MAHLRAAGLAVVLSLIAASASGQIASRCVRPFAIPDRWLEVQTPPWDPADTFDRYDRFGQVITNPDQYSELGYRQPDSEALALSLKQLGFGEIYGFSFFPAELGSGPDTGGEAFRNSIISCADQVVTIGDSLLVVSGNLLGPTRQGAAKVLTRSLHRTRALTGTLQSTALSGQRTK